MTDTKPLDMVIHCPRCGDQHIDEPDPETGWTNPPHKSHLCSSCGIVWRVADVPTNGVAATMTQGKSDNWFPPLALAVGVTTGVDPVIDIDDKPVDETATHGHKGLRSEGDEYVCSHCGKRWGFDDPDVPGCTS